LGEPLRRTVVIIADLETASTLTGANLATTLAYVIDNKIGILRDLTVHEQKQGESKEELLLSILLD